MTQLKKCESCGSSHGLNVLHIKLSNRVKEDLLEISSETNRGLLSTAYAMIKLGIEHYRDG